MSKNNKNGVKAPKAPKAPNKAPKVNKAPGAAAQQPAASQEAEEVEVVTLPMAADPKKLTDRRYSGLSPDGQVKLLDLAHRVFVEEKDPDLQFPQTVRKNVNEIVAAGIICSFADHAVNGTDSFAMVIQSQMYPALSEAAKQIGVKLPDVKALPAGQQEGTVVLDSTKADISKETKAKLQQENKIRNGEKPELDPTKISSAEDVTKALQYMFLASGGKRLPTLLTESIEFMKKFRMHEAELADNTEEAKARFANYNSGSWLDDVFSYFQPPIFFTGIGKGMADVTWLKKNPIHAFIILRDAIKDKETKQPVLEDQEIAYCAKAIIKWYCNTNITSNKKAIENLDAKKNKKEIEMCEAQIQKYNDILAYITSPSSDEADHLLEHIGNHFDEGGTLTTECQAANGTYFRVCKSYYGKNIADSEYKNIAVNIQQYCGYIINLFRDPNAAFGNYSLSNICELEPRSEEEREAMLLAARKEFAEKKAAEKKAETKNA